MAPSIPTEIIQLILRELRPDASASVVTALYASAISRHWRAVALSTPSIWSTFSFCLWTHDETMLSAFYTRSLQEPLHITIPFDFPRADKYGAGKAQRAIALFKREAGRVRSLRLRFLKPIYGQSDVLTEILCTKLSGLKFLELESLVDDTQWPNRVYLPDVNWSECCPALTHVTCTNPDIFLNIPTTMTHLCIKGAPDRRNIIEFSRIEPFLEAAAQTLTDLVIDRVSLRNSYNIVALPYLHALTLRSSPLPLDSASGDAEALADVLDNLDAPVLASLVIPELNELLPAWFDYIGVRVPSVTRFAVVPGLSDTFCNYPQALPNVEELVLLGSNTTLRIIAGLSGGAWPNLRTIDLTELEPPFSQCLGDLSDNLYRYGCQRCAAGHALRVKVRLPRGVLPSDVRPDVAEFMDVICTA